MKATPVDHRIFYPALMGLCATLLFLSSADPIQSPNFRSGMLCFTGVFAGYYLATLKPVLRTSEHRLKLHVTGRWQYLIFALPLLLLLPDLRNFPQVMQFMVAGFLTLAYYLHWEMKEWRFGGLRAIPLVKNITLGLAWAFTTVPLQADYSDLLFLHRFLYLLSLSIVIDLRDLDQDRQSAIRTLPMQIGLSGTRLLITLIIALSGVAGYLFSIKTAQPDLLTAWLISLVSTTICLLLLSPAANRTSFLLQVDGNLLLYSILTFSHLRF